MASIPDPIRQTLKAAAGHHALPAEERSERLNELEFFLLGLPIDEALAIAADVGEGQAPLEGFDYQMEGGLLVFSAWYHLRRGYCCGNGCRHCPYPPSHKN